MFWNIFKKIYIITSIASSFIIFYYLSSKFFNFLDNNSNKENKEKVITNLANDIILNKDKLNILVGKDENDNNVYIPYKGLFQNILVTGTIGSGKTSSFLYPVTKQLISYKSNNIDEKLAMLILDVKGNYYKHVLSCAKSVNRQNDVIIIKLGGRYKYNPLDKPNLKPQILANRLITILKLFRRFRKF